MPFTTYHIAVGLLVGFFLRKRADWLTLLVTTAVLIDIEPVLVYYGLLRESAVHGYLHTFLASVPMGVVSGLLLYSIRGILKHIAKITYLNGGDYCPRKYITAGLLGWSLHVLMDAPVYPDIKPFYPLVVNPLYNSLSPTTLEFIYNTTLILGFMIYTVHFYKSYKREGLPRIPVLRKLRATK
jgi:hypothetical protein